MSMFPFLGGFKVTLKQVLEPRVTSQYPLEKQPKPPRLHGRHVLNRYEDGMEKCIGCELCAAVCPADCIYVRGKDNPPEDPVSPGERYGFVYEINYLRCIHCDLCVEACPDRGDHRVEDVRVLLLEPGRRDLHQGRARGRRRRQAAAVALGGLAPGRRPEHVGLDAGYLSFGLGGLRRGGPVVRRASATACAHPRAARAGSRDDAATGNISIRDRRTEQDLRRASAARCAEIVHGPLLAATIPDAVTFVMAAAICVVGALGVVLSKNPVHSALMLIMTLFGVAVLFVEENAQFLGRGPGDRLCGCDRRALPVRHHAARRRPAGDDKRRPARPSNGSGPSSSVP